MQKMITSKNETIRQQSLRLRLQINNYGHYGNRGRLRDYSGGIRQTDDKSKEKLNFRIYPNPTSSLLVSRLHLLNLRWFSIGGIKNQHDAILESFGFKNLELASSVCYSQSSNLILVKF